MTVETEMVVTAKRVGCKHKVDLRAGDVAPGDHPCCPKCYMPMVATKVQTKRVRKGRP